jgi:hypothetical protein
MIYSTLCRYCSPKRCLCAEEKLTDLQFKAHLEMLIQTWRRNYEVNPFMFPEDGNKADRWQAVLDIL